MMHTDNFEQFTQKERDTHNEEEFAAVLDALLPEIERQLMKDIERQLQAQFQQKYLNAIEGVDNQALKEYQQAMQELQESRHLLQQQKQRQTQQEISILQSTLASLEQDGLLKLQEKFLEENFDSRVMIHSRILSLEKVIQEEIFTELEEKHQMTKQRQVKELIIAHETKQIKLRKQLDAQIKSRIYCSSGLEELKQQIKQSKTQMGSQKSEYNLKLKKIQTEIKEYQDKVKKLEKMGDVDNLREKYEELRVQLIERETEKQLEDDEKIRNQQQRDEDDIDEGDRNDDSLDEEEDDEAYHQLNHRNQNNHRHSSNSKTLKRQHKNQLLAPEIVHRQHNNDEFDDSQSQQFVNSQNNSKKFDLTAYFKDYLLNSQTAQITESQTIQQDVKGSQNRTLLNLGNLSEILKQKVSIDPLERYFNKQGESKQNDMNSQNSKYPKGQKSSNFAQLYEQHLKNLNKGFGNKKTVKNTSLSNKTSGISEMAKKTIIKNLALYHRDNFTNRQNKLKSSQSRNQSSKAATENFNSYESNLLGSYK